MCVLANKQDLETAVSADELASILEVSSLEAPHVVLPAVSKTGEGLDAAMIWLSENIKPI